jgi:hypothetical protein
VDGDLAPTLIISFNNNNHVLVHIKTVSLIIITIIIKHIFMFSHICLCEFRRSRASEGPLRADNRQRKRHADRCSDTHPVSAAATPRQLTQPPSHNERIYALNERIPQHSLIDHPFYLRYVQLGLE